MKRISLVVAAFMLLSLFSNAQGIALDQLVQMSDCADDSCFAEVVSPLGYTFGESNINEKNEIYTFRGSERYKLYAVRGTDFADMITYSIMNTGKTRSVAFRTVNAEHYHDFLGQLFNSEFKVSQEMKIEGGEFKSYKSDDPSKTITVTSRSKSFEDKDYIEFSIAIIRS
ncbi:MAG: hypothetical protein HKN39_05205 [Flavobacteriales bacterium]|nr:hypothetical protein [Flavobacteriales bacterium]